MTEEQLRLFVAIDPPPAIAASIEKVLAPARRLAPDEKWSSLSKLHLTLVFLGHLPASTVEPIGAALSRAAARAAAFDAQVRGAGTFGRGSRARVLWLGVDGGDALVRLQAAVAEELEAFGHREERDYRPHLTLARARAPQGSRALAAVREALAEHDFGRFRVQEIVLYRSELSPQGARYAALGRYRLGG